MERWSARLAGLFGFFGVATGALGGHAVKHLLEAAPDGAQRLTWWDLGARYHLLHAVAMGVAGVVAAHSPSKAGPWAARLFAVGATLFAGSLYVMALTGSRAFAVVTPVGGVSFLAGWVALTLAAFKL
jgi:uncharacterized membrane protein YgdD (TMEM256/DUF423 family)